MTIEILEPFAGSFFAYRKGEVLSSDKPEKVEQFKKFVKSGRAREIAGEAKVASPAARAERKVKTDIEHR